MTDTRRWLQSRSRRLARLGVAGAVLLTTGAVLCTLAAGQLVGRLGVYARAPLVVWIGWLMAAAVLVWGGGRLIALLRGVRVERLARAAEATAGRRRGSVTGLMVEAAAGSSVSLTTLADAQARAWLETEGAGALAPVARRYRRILADGGSVFAVGLALFVGAVLTGGNGGFWNPVAVTARSNGPVSIAVDRTEVRRGDSVTVSVRAPGRRTAALHVRAPGEAWSAQVLRLDAAGTGRAVIGPLQSDRYMRAVAGERTSEVVRVTVALPALLSDLEILARFPDYLHRSDLPLFVGTTPVPLPVGTRVMARGRASVNLAHARWVRDTTKVAGNVDGERFTAAFGVRATGTWRLELETIDHGPVEGAVPTVAVIAVEDSTPVVQVPIPGSDTVAPLSLRQRLLIDAQDDHGITDLSIVSWRVSRFGVSEAPDTEAVALPTSGVARAVVSWVLDLNERGLLPGDTAYFLVRAVDNAPAPHVGVSAKYRLRLRSMSEVREATRERGSEARAAADSLVRAQDALTRRFEELAAEQQRRGRVPANVLDPVEPEQLQYSAVQRAQELLDEERTVAERAEELRSEVSELADAAWASGLTDPELQQTLRDVQQLIERALDRDLMDRIQQLQQALDRLDAEGTRVGLEELARAANALRDELRRSRELFERAAIEGDLTSLAADADELAQAQRAWNEMPEQASDSTLATQEGGLADGTERLARDLEQLGAQLDSLAGGAGELQAEREDAGAAASAMTRAAEYASRGLRLDAQSTGQQASRVLDPMGQQLRQRRDELREGWRREVLAQMDRALVETGEMIKRQQDIAGRLEHGEAGNDVRGEQAAVREGVDRVVERLSNAAGKNALVSPQLGTALGVARQRMDDALGQLQQPTPGTREATAMAGQALEQLNAVVHALLQSRGDVQGARSGSGLSEAIERMAQLAEEQGALNGQTGGLMPMVAAGGAELLQRLRELARQQRGLAQALERMQATGGPSATAELAEEAREIARRLEQGQLNRDIVERQERLFRRMLDAGRSLRSDDEDPRLERESKSADPAVVAPPTDTAPTEAAPRYRFPTWDELRALTPQERFLILDYFRRLNDARRP